MMDQADEQSVLDRLEATLDAEVPEEEDEVNVDERLDDTPDEDEEEEAEETDEVKPDAETEAELAEVEFEGKNYKVPAEIKDALLRQADYTRKTQEVAEQRREVETVKEQLGLQAQMQQQFLGYYAQLQALDNQMAQAQQINWSELIDSDPVQALKLDRQFREVSEFRNKVQAELDQQMQAAYEQQMTWQQQQLAKGQEQLMQDIPGWGKELAQQIRNVGKEYGFTDQELSVVTDPRHVKVLNDAMKYRQLMAQKPSVEKKVAKANPVLKPSAPKNQGAEKTKQIRDQLRKTGSMKDAAAALERFL